MRGGMGKYQAAHTGLALTGDDGETGTDNVHTNFVTGTAINLGDTISGWFHGGKRRRTRRGKSRKGRKGKKTGRKSTRKGRRAHRRR